MYAKTNTRVVWKVFELAYNQRENRDKQQLGRDQDRSWCHCHTSVKFFWSEPKASWTLPAP